MAASQPGPPQRPLVNGSQDPSTPFPVLGELIMLRLPFAVTLGPPSIISPSALSGATLSNYHPAIVLNTNTSRTGLTSYHFTWDLEILLILRFSTSPDPAGFVRSMSPEWQRCLLPLPVAAGIERPPTPPEFGLELQVPGYYGRRISWLSIRSISLQMPDNAPYQSFAPRAVMSANEITRILDYARCYSTPPIPTSIPTPVPDPPNNDAGGSTPKLPPPAPNTMSPGNLGQHPFGYLPALDFSNYVDDGDDEDDDDDDPRNEISLEFLEMLFAPTSEYFAKLQRDREEKKREAVQQWVDCL